MFRKPLLLLFLMSSLAAFGQHTFTIEGKIEAGFQQKIQIAYLDKIDSIISQNGEFRFTGTIEHPVLITFSATDIVSKKFVNKELFVERGLVKIHSTFHALRSTVPYLEFNTSQRVLDNYNNRFFLLIDLYRFTTDSLVKNPNATPDGKRIAKKLAQKIYAFEELYEKDFIIQNTGNHVGAFFFYRYGANFMEEKEIDSVYHLFPENIRNSFYLKSVEEKIRYSTLLKEGKPVPTIFLQDPKQAKVAVKNLFTSRLTLLDIWASWCVPCVETHELLKILHVKYNTKGLNIVGISIDDKKESWLKYLNKAAFPWKNFIDPDGSKGEINKMFSLEAGNGIPFFLFINEKGEYLKINIDSEELEAFIKDYLKG